MKQLLNSGLPTSSPAAGQTGGLPVVRNVVPGLSRFTDESLLSQASPAARIGGSPLDQLIPDPAIYKFETGTGYQLRPVIQPDGQSVVFHLNYMYTTNVREPVRADEKHLGRIKRHYIDTDVQLGNYELREISRYQVSLRASRTSKGVPLLQDIPGLGVLFRPLPSADSALQQNLILSQAVVYPTLFDLMGLRWAPAVADLDPLAVRSADFVVRQRHRFITNRVFDTSTGEVDNALRIPEAQRRTDLYRSQDTIPYVHPNGYYGPGLGIIDSHMRPGYDVPQLYPQSRFAPTNSPNGVPEPTYPGGYPPHGMTPTPQGIPSGTPLPQYLPTSPANGAGVQAPPSPNGAFIPPPPTLLESGPMPKPNSVPPITSKTPQEMPQLTNPGTDGGKKMPTKPAVPGGSDHTPPPPGSMAPFGLPRGQSGVLQEGRLGSPAYAPPSPQGGSLPQNNAFIELNPILNVRPTPPIRSGNPMDRPSSTNELPAGNAPFAPIVPPPPPPLPLPPR